MGISVTVRNTTLTDSLRRHTNDKLGNLDRFFDAVQTVDVVLQVEEHRQVAECVCHIKRHEPLVAQAEGESLYTAIDLLAHKMERQLRKLKGKVSSGRHKNVGLGRESAAAATRDDDEKSEQQDTA